MYIHACPNVSIIHACLIIPNSVDPVKEIIHPGPVQVT